MSESRPVQRPRGTPIHGSTQTPANRNGRNITNLRTAPPSSALGPENAVDRYTTDGSRRSFAQNTNGRASPTGFLRGLASQAGESLRQLSRTVASAAVVVGAAPAAATTALAGALALATADKAGAHPHRERLELLETGLTLSVFSSTDEIPHALIFRDEVTLDLFATPDLSGFIVDPAQIKQAFGVELPRWMTNRGTPYTVPFIGFEEDHRSLQERVVDAQMSGPETENQRTGFVGGPDQVEVYNRQRARGVSHSVAVAIAQSDVSDASPPKVTETQRQLAIQISSGSPERFQFLKDRPVVMYPITKLNYASLPGEIRDVLGAVDGASYAKHGSFEAFMEEQVGGAIVLQFNGDEPDFYPLPPDVYRNQYAPVPMREVREKNAALFGSLQGAPGLPDLLQGDPNVTGAIKTTPVAMISASSAGYPMEIELEIEAPWGGTQTKPAGRDAFLAQDDDGKYYMVNVDSSGLPIGYRATWATGEDGVASDPS